MTDMKPTDMTPEQALERLISRALRDGYEAGHEDTRDSTYQPEYVDQNYRAEFISECDEVEIVRNALRPPVPAQTIKLGMFGSAYDGPEVCRAYTYQHQPHNGPAMSLGSATNRAAKDSAGDEIDRGLSLLKRLQEEGFGVFDLKEGALSPAPAVPADLKEVFSRIEDEIARGELTAAQVFTRMRTAVQSHATPAPAVPEGFAEISRNLRTQDNRITADPLFVVFQKRTVVVNEDYDYDRIAWHSSDEGYEASAEEAERLDRLRDDLESDYCGDDVIPLDDVEWTRLAIKEVDEFVTACFTEVGAQAYLDDNRHNLRRPFIFVTSLYRNDEMRSVRNWLMSLATPTSEESSGDAGESEQAPVKESLTTEQPEDGPVAFQFGDELQYVANHWPPPPGATPIGPLYPESVKVERDALRIENTELRERMKKLKADAARYRFLRSHADTEWHDDDYIIRLRDIPVLVATDDIDLVTDTVSAAMQEGKS